VELLKALTAPGQLSVCFFSGARPGEAKVTKSKKQKSTTTAAPAVPSTSDGPKRKPRGKSKPKPPLDLSFIDPLDQPVIGAKAIAAVLNLRTTNPDGDSEPDARKAFFGLQQGYYDADKVGREWRSTPRRLLGPTRNVNSLIAPAVVIRPILLPWCSVNQSAPSGPAVMPWGPLPGVGTVNSVMTPVVVIRPILLPLYSVNHNAPSGPAVISKGSLLAVGIVNSLITPAVVIRPMLLA